MSTEDKTVTIIVHGTFARTESWWRTGASAKVPFADNLELALARRGLKNTVWQPVLDHGFSFEDFSWTGENRHKDRVKGAKHFCRKLGELAKKMGATADQPLSLNLVSHSHGGNVCLEVLRYLPSTVRLNRFVTLGTPFIVAKPAARLIRFVAAVIVFLLLLVVPLNLAGSAANFAWFNVAMFFSEKPDSKVQLVHEAGCEYKIEVREESKQFNSDSNSQFTNYVDARAGMEKAKCELKKETWQATFFLLIYAPLLAMFCSFFDVLAQFFVILLLRLKNSFRAMLCRFFPSLPPGRSSHKAYGPSDFALKRIVGPGQMLAVTSHLDEAELVLEVGTAPARLYDEFVQSIRSRFKRLMERLFLKGLVSGLILKGLEALFERISLGMPFWRVMWFNYEVDHPTLDRNYYPKEYMKSERLQLEVEAAPLSLAMTRDRNAMSMAEADDDNDENLRLSLKEVIDDLKQQIRLRHSSYYSSPEVMNLISDFIAGPVTETESTEK
jgi:hypothetical protein